MIRTKGILSVAKQAFKKWISRDPFRESSVIAYAAIFSLPGLMVVIVTMAGYFFGSELVNQHLHETIAGALGVDTADQIEQIIIAANRNRDSIWATVLGIITILIGATGVFVQMQKSLNIIWEVEAKPNKSGVWTFLKMRIFSFGLILSIAFLMLLSLVISTVFSAASDYLRQNWSESVIWLFNLLNFIVSIGIITVLFAMMFQILPDAKVKWRYVWVGAFATALLFTIGKTLMGLYFGKAEPGSGYGAAGSIILVLLWSSYTSMIVFYGAEFTRAYSDYHYGHVAASEIGVKKKGRVI
jgi:membrane protein